MTMTQDAIDRQAFHTATPRPTESTGLAPIAVSLPATKASRGWYDQTRALLADLRKQKAARQEASRLAQQEAEALDGPISALVALLKRVQVPEAPPSTPVAGRDGKPWSTKHAACLGCGTTEKRHMSRGLCSTCYFRERDKSA